MNYENDMEVHRKLPPAFWQEGCLMWQVGSAHLYCGIGPFSFQNSPISGAFYKDNFFLEEPNPWVVPQQIIKVTPQDFFLEIPLLPRASLCFSQPAWETYARQYQTLAQLFQKGHVQKGVPYINRVAAGNLTDLLGGLKNLFFDYQKRGVFLKTEDHPSVVHIVGYWSQSRHEGFVGATPELLFIRTENIMHTIALAGTYSGMQNWDELASVLQNKLKIEHEFVISDLQNSLEKWGKLEWESTQTQFHMGGKLHHLLTPLALHFVDSKPSFEEILQSLHPTAALGVYPKNKEGLTWLRVCRDFLPRYLYGGVWGLALEGQRQYASALIRCLFWEKEHLFLYAGGGVTSGSSQAEEQAELELKLHAIQTHFGFR